MRAAVSSVQCGESKGEAVDDERQCRDDSAVYLNQRKNLQPEQCEAWKDTRLLIIDEISFASKKDLEKIHRVLRKLRQQLHLPYGGLSIIFSGDMRQLEPVGDKKPVYQENCPEFKDWVNCFIELDGLHRFKDDKKWGELLFRFRDGNATPEDINEINERVVKEDTHLPGDIRYATYRNCDRDSINAAVFEEHCQHMYDLHGHTNDAIMIFSDDLKVKNGDNKYIPFNNGFNFWENCGEANIKAGRSGRMDPVLRLYSNCRTMLTQNSNVRAGKANGTQALFQKVVLKRGTQLQTVKLNNGISVKAVLASEVDHIILRHCNDRIEPQVFAVKPKKFSFVANILKPSVLRTKGDERETIRMTATQIPLIINNATTGHKLQGSGVDNVFVHTWSYTTNWVYVMLSRVKTKKGLFMRKPLSRDLRKYVVPKALLRMLERMRKHTPSYWSDEQYNELFGNN